MNDNKDGLVDMRKQSPKGIIIAFWITLGALCLSLSAVLITYGKYLYVNGFFHRNWISLTITLLFTVYIVVVSIRFYVAHRDATYTMSIPTGIFIKIAKPKCPLLDFWTYPEYDKILWSDIANFRWVNKKFPPILFRYIEFELTNGDVVRLHVRVPDLTAESIESFMRWDAEKKEKESE